MDRIASQQKPYSPNKAILTSLAKLPWDLQQLSRIKNIVEWFVMSSVQQAFFWVK